MISTIKVKLSSGISKYVASALFVIGALSSNAQSIHIDQLDKDFTSYLHSQVIASADSVLNASEFTISLASLKKKCDSPNDCYEVSIIEEDYDRSDSLLWNPFVYRIRTDLFDSIVPLNIEYYEVVLGEILIGNVPSEEAQLMSVCYNPRHAVLIRDQADKILAVFEICFECGKSQVAFSRIETVEGIPDAINGIFWRYGLK